VISLTNALGVHSERTLLREIPGRNVTAWVTSARRRRPASGPDLPCGLDHEGQAVGAEQVSAVLLEGFDVFVADRHFSNPASMRNCTGEPGHGGGKQRQDDQHQTTMPEQPGLDARQDATHRLFRQIDRDVHGRPHRVRERTRPT
jgi:hypothetical protein